MKNHSRRIRRGVFTLAEYSNLDYLDRIEAHRLHQKRLQASNGKSQDQQVLLKMTERAYSNSSQKNKIKFAEMVRNRKLEEFI